MDRVRLRAIGGWGETRRGANGPMRTMLHRHQCQNYAAATRAEAAIDVEQQDTGSPMHGELSGTAPAASSSHAKALHIMDRVALFQHHAHRLHERAKRARRLAAAVGGDVRERLLGLADRSEDRWRVAQYCAREAERRRETARRKKDDRAW
jgi:hypothetical protein